MKSKTRVVILVRHSHYDLASGKLTAMGKRQAILTARILREANPTKLYSSPKPRAKETASIIADELGLKTQIRSYFIEGYLPGTAGYNSRSDRSQRSALALKRKIALRAFEKAFDFIILPPTRSEVIIVVCHENVIRHFICKFLGSAPSKRWRNISIGHVSISTIQTNSEGRAVLTGLSEQTHLPFALRTGTI